MFMASNQFRVVRGREAAFEAAWAETSARLSGAKGLIGLRFDKGRELNEHVLYFAVTIWESEMRFLEWRRHELYGGCLSPRNVHAGLAPSRLEGFATQQSRETTHSSAHPLESLEFCLGIGEKLLRSKLPALCLGSMFNEVEEEGESAFEAIDETSFPGKWRVSFF